MLTKMISGLIISSICFSEFCPVSRIRMSSLGNFKNRVNTNRKRKKTWSQTCFKESGRLGRHSKKPQRTKPVYLNTSEVTCRVRRALQDANLTSRLTSLCPVSHLVEKNANHLRQQRPPPHPAWQPVPAASSTSPSMAASRRPHLEIHCQPHCPSSRIQGPGTCMK